MPPKDEKKKRKKKTKEELEEERRQAEEAARLAEEERKRLEEEERQRLAEIEAHRVELLNEHLATEAARVEAERQELEPVLGQMALERARASEARLATSEWERLLSCTYVPAPHQRIAVSDYISLLQQGSDATLTEALDVCQDCRQMVDELGLARLEALLQDDKGEDTAAAYEKDVATLHDIVTQRIDHVTAHVLQHSDEHANERNEVQLATRRSIFQWALWVNTSKNPRLKTVEFPQLALVVEIPKQIALSNIALRMQHRGLDEFFRRCTNEFMAVGGVLYADLLALPPPAKRMRGWVLRQVSPLTSNVQRVPYPIPPAGADPLTYRSEEEPLPLGFTYPLAPDVLLLEEPLKVGWWDESIKGWSMEGISDVSADKAAGTITFRSTHLAPLAFISARTRLLPYQGWSIRPTGGRNGTAVAVTLDVGLPEPVVLDVTAGSVALASPSWPQLEALVGVALPPGELLTRLSQRGLHLLPEDRDARFAGVMPKTQGTERALCQELPLICGAFLVASSRWNQVAGSEEALARISEVVDWEEGGRTEPHHVARIFAKEKEDGERRVITVVQRGTRGVAFSGALNKHDSYQALPGTATVEEVQACALSILGEVHASLLSLLKGHQGEQQDSALALRLQGTPEGLETCRNTDPLMTQTLGQLLLALRVFSFA